MANGAVSPSEGTITAGQAAKFGDLIIARLRKSGLPSELTQYVLEHGGVEIVDAFEADVRLRVETHRRAIEPHLLQRKPFSPEQFLGKGWKINEPPGQCTGDSLDTGKIVWKDYLRQGESFINGKKRLKRIKAAPDVQLDANDFLALWREKGHITLEWLYDTKGITFLSFWGTILRNPSGRRDVLYLARDCDGSWFWNTRWISGGVWHSSSPTAVLVSSLSSQD